VRGRRDSERAKKREYDVAHRVLPFAQQRTIPIMPPKTDLHDTTKNVR
jgi:hypothetical protein